MSQESTSKMSIFLASSTKAEDVDRKRLLFEMFRWKERLRRSEASRELAERIEFYAYEFEDDAAANGAEGQQARLFNQVATCSAAIFVFGREAGPATLQELSVAMTAYDAAIRNHQKAIAIITLPPANKEHPGDVCPQIITDLREKYSSKTGCYFKEYRTGDQLVGALLDVLNELKDPDKMPHEFDCFDGHTEEVDGITYTYVNDQKPDWLKAQEHADSTSTLPLSWNAVFIDKVTTTDAEGKQSSCCYAGMTDELSGGKIQQDSSGLDSAITSGAQVERQILWETCFLPVEAKLKLACMLNYQFSLSSSLPDHRTKEYKHAYDLGFAGSGHEMHSIPREMDDYVREIFDSLCRHYRGSLQNFKSTNSLEASLFLQPSPEQYEVYEAVKSKVQELMEDPAPETLTQGTLIIISGEAGCGKSMLLTRLLQELSQKDEDHTYLLVNNDEIIKSYSNLNGESTRSSKGHVLSVYQYLKLYKHGNGTGSASQSKDRQGQEAAQKPPVQTNVVLIDEAHNLINAKRSNTISATGAENVYYGDKILDSSSYNDEELTPEQRDAFRFHKNELYDVLLRARVVVLVIDHNQVMRHDRLMDPGLEDAAIRINEKYQIDAAAQDAGTRTVMKDLGDIELHCHEIKDGHATTEMESRSFKAYGARLTHPKRLRAPESVVRWICALADEHTTAAHFLSLPEGIRSDDNLRGYELKVFDDPNDLYDAVLSSSEGNGEEESCRLRRVVATYDWSVHEGVCIAPHPKYCTQKQGESTGSAGADGAEERGMTKEFKKRWAGYDNKNPSAWVYDNDQTDKDQGGCWWQHIGSYHQVQGADLDVIGVIIGPSIIFDEAEGHIKAVPKKSHNIPLSSIGPIDTSARTERWDSEVEELVEWMISEAELEGQNKDGEEKAKLEETLKTAYRQAQELKLEKEFTLNQLRVLLTRGINGLYIYADDPGLRKQLLTAQDAWNRKHDPEANEASPSD